MNEFASIVFQLKSGHPATLTRTADGAVYTRRFIPTQRLILLGAGHVAQPVCHIASMLDFVVTVVDDREAFCNAQRFPDAAQTLRMQFPDAISALQITAADYVCVLTRGHSFDAVCLRQLLRGELPAYLGMISSRHRAAGLLEVLEAEGFAPQQLAQIHSPIGLPIQAATPAEIAVSICAELIAHRRAVSETDANVLARTNPDLRALTFLAQMHTPRAMLLVLQTSGSTPVKSGAMMGVDALGNGYGTIGGGGGEAAAMAKARRSIGTGKREVFTVTMDNAVAAERGLACGGAMRVLLEDLPVEG